MLKPVLKWLLALELLMAASQACAAPAAPSISALDPNAVDTAIAGTMAAAWTQTARLAPPLSPTSTLTPTRPSSPTPYPTFTPVVAGVRIYVTKNTACRAGPGQVYNIVGSLKVGETAEVVGRSADAQYWIIRLPGHPEKTCWLWGGYANVVGVVGVLSVFTPPPTPKPTRTPTRVPPTDTATPVYSIPTDFTILYSGKDLCAGTGWWLDFTLINTGQVTFQSVALILQDATTGGAPFLLASDDFTDKNGCSQNTLDTLPPGTTSILSSPVLSYDPTGHAVHATISLCTAPAQSGACIAREIEFMP